MHEALALQWRLGKSFEIFDRVKISPALKYRAGLEEEPLQGAPEARPGCLGHCREERKRGGRIERGRERRISGRMRLTRLRQTNKQLNRLTGDGGTDESY